MQDVAQGEGDLTKRLNIELKNEVGGLASWFNVFIDRMNVMIKEVASDGNKLRDSSDQLSSVTVQMFVGGGQCVNKNDECC